MQSHTNISLNFVYQSQMSKSMCSSSHRPSCWLSSIIVERRSVALVAPPPTVLAAVKSHWSWILLLLHLLSPSHFLLLWNLFTTWYFRSHLALPTTSSKKLVLFGSCGQLVTGLLPPHLACYAAWSLDSILKWFLRHRWVTRNWYSILWQALQSQPWYSQTASGVYV